MYYQRLDVKEAILSFKNNRVGSAVRECAIYNRESKSVQRYESDSHRPIDLNSGLDQIAGTDASAFYCSYWHYVGDFNNPVGSDLVWTIRAKRGGMATAKFVTKLVVEALDEVGVKPWVKFSGNLGFDLVIPLQAIPYEVWLGDLGALDRLHRELTTHIVGNVNDRMPEAETKATGNYTIIRIETDICLLSELRVRRGLLLAPMSLNPETGLVSVPVDPERIGDFKVFDATPELARPIHWSLPAEPALGLLKYAQQWQQTTSESELKTVL